MVDGEVLSLDLQTIEVLPGAGRHGMRSAWLAVRSALLWAVSGIHFIGGVVLISLRNVVSRRKIDPFVWVFKRNVVRLAGARVSVKFAPDLTASDVFFCRQPHQPF